jgi:hypothetical protein
MTGQDSGFHAAKARFSAAVEAALTRARRAAGEAKAQSAGFRRATQELAEQAKTGRLRGVPRAQVEPTPTEQRDEAAKFRNTNGLPVEELPDADRLLARLPDEPGTKQEDEDFSQRQVLFDLDAPPELVEPASHPVEPERAETDPPEPAPTRPSDEDEDFSQQRILLDATVESYRPDSLQRSVFELPDEQNPS